MTSTVDNCCQRAKVHRLVTQPGWFVKSYVLVMLQLISFQSAFIFYFIFHEIMFFKALSAFMALLFIQSALFFLQSAFLFLHSAFLILHSAFLKFSVWVSTCIFSPIVSQLRYFTLLPNYHAAIILILKCEALISWLV